MHVLFLDKNWEGRKTGATVWRDGLLNNLNSKHSIITVPKNPLSFFVTLIKNKKKIFGADIVQTHVATFGILFLCILLKLLRKKHVHMLHGDYFLESLDKGKLYILKYNLILSVADLVVFPTEYLKENILKKKKIKNICVIHPGIEIKLNKAKWKKPKSFLEITSFTRKEKCNGLIPLIAAFNEIKAPNDELIIIGGGPHLKEFKAKYSSKQVRFIGFQKDVFPWIKKCDAFVHSSYLESFGIILLEAMMYNKPILTVNVQGIPEAVGNGGIIVEPTKNALAKGFLELKSKKPAHLKEQEKHLKKFDWEKITQAFEISYESLLKKTIFIIRHGETKFNVEKIITGQKNPPLTQNGFAQAQTIGTFFKQIPSGKVYSSDLQRSYTTAKQISSKVQKDKLLRELYFGKLEGKKVPVGKKIILSEYDVEDLVVFRKRLEKFLKKVRKEKRTIIVAHEGTNKMLKSIITQKPYNYSEKQQNTEIFIAYPNEKKVLKENIA